MAQSVFFDSQIITSINDGVIRAADWKGVLERLAGRYKYRVSFTTFMEIVNALARSDEHHFEQNRKRLVLLTDVDGCQFLPMPGQFIRTAVLGLPLERPEFSPERLQRVWMPAIRKAQSRGDLSLDNVVTKPFSSGIDPTFGIDLDGLKKEMGNGKKRWGEELQLAKDDEKDMPPAARYSAFILRFDGHAPQTQENIEKVSRALDAAYSHLKQIHHESAKSGYRFDKNLQDWIDNQQLMYLADPELTFVTADKRLIAKLGKSKDRGRVRQFAEFTKAI